MLLATYQPKDWEKSISYANKDVKEMLGIDSGKKMYWCFAANNVHQALINSYFTGANAPECLILFEASDYYKIDKLKWEKMIEEFDFINMNADLANINYPDVAEYIVTEIPQNRLEIDLEKVESIIPEALKRARMDDVNFGEFSVITSDMVATGENEKIDEYFKDHHIPFRNRMILFYCYDINRLAKEYYERVDAYKETLCGEGSVVYSGGENLIEEFSKREINEYARFQSLKIGFESALFYVAYELGRLLLDESYEFTGGHYEVPSVIEYFTLKNEFIKFLDKNTRLTVKEAYRQYTALRKKCYKTFFVKPGTNMRMADSAIIKIMSEGIA